MNQPEARPIPAETRRGRGALSNAAGRFEPHQRIAIDDGWPDGKSTPPLRTQVSIEAARSIIARNTSPDLGFDRSINPYRGCEHGCAYCYARPSHAFIGLSPGLDFETRLQAKPNAATLLRAELCHPGYTPAPIAIGTNTDPYQPIEKDWRIMRQVLEVLREHQHPVTVLTKGALIARDADILGEMGQGGLAHAGISLTTLDARLSRAMEPRAAAPAHRLRLIETLAGAGCPVRVMIAPVIPALNDHEIEALLKSASDAGASAAEFITLRLPGEVAGLFRQWLDEAYPDRASRIMNQVRDMQGGRDYNPGFGTRFTGSGVHAAMIKSRFAVATRRLGLAGALPALRCDLFHVPPSGRPEQLSLFG